MRVLKDAGRVLAVACVLALAFVSLEYIISLRGSYFGWGGFSRLPWMSVIDGMADLIASGRGLNGFAAISVILALGERCVRRWLWPSAAEQAQGSGRDDALSASVTTAVVAALAVPLVGGAEGDAATWADKLLRLTSGASLLAFLLFASLRLVRELPKRPALIRASAIALFVLWVIAIGAVAVAGIAPGARARPEDRGSLAPDISSVPRLDLVVWAAVATLLLRAAVKAAAARQLATAGRIPTPPQEAAWVTLALLPVGVMVGLTGAPVPSSWSAPLIEGLIVSCVLACSTALVATALEHRSTAVAGTVSAVLIVAAALPIGIRWRSHQQRSNQIAAERQRIELMVRGLKTRDSFDMSFWNRSQEQLRRLAQLQQRISEGVPGSTLMDLETVAREVGLKIANSSVERRTRGDVLESALTLNVEASPASLARFVERLTAQRLVRFDDLFLPGPQGTIRLRVFAITASPDLLPPACGSQRLPYPLPDRDWIFSTFAARVDLWRACLLNQSELEFVARARVLERLEKLNQSESASAPPIRTEYRLSDLRSDSLRLTRFRESSAGWVAEAVPGKRPIELRVGDAISDGAVRSVAIDHVIMEVSVVTETGKPPVKRLLRFERRQPLPPVRLGHDTTRVSAPLFAEPDPRRGTPDYLAWVNDRYGAGVTRETNAANRLHAALDALTDAGLSFFDEAIREKQTWRPWSSPWSAKDCAICADRLARNEKALAEIVETVRLPRYFLPAPAGAPASGLWSPAPLLRLRWAANALAGRGMLRIGRGDLKGAAEDALAGQRLAVLVSQGPQLIQNLIALALRGIDASLVPSIAGQPSLTAGDARRILLELEALPEIPSPTLTVDAYERFHELDQILMLRLAAAETGSGGMRAFLEPDWQRQMGEKLKLDPIVYLVPTSGWDWDEALRLVNRQFDLSVSAMRATTADERRSTRVAIAAEREDFDRRVRSVLETLQKGVRREQSAHEDVAQASEALLRTPEGRRQLAHLLVSPETQPYRSTIAWNEAEVGFRLGVAALALAVHRLEKGRYPDTLDSLGSDLAPGRFAPAAPIRGYVLRYRAAATPPGPGAYALVAVPEEVKLTGNRSFCVDSKGTIRATSDGSTPGVAAGVCDPRVPLLR